MKLVGSARTPYVLATSIFESSAMGNVSLCWAMKGGTTLGLESSETPTITNPWSLWPRQRRSIAGISSLHGSHHVAQKFRKTILPWCSERRNVLPSGMGSVKSPTALIFTGLMSSSDLRATSTSTTRPPRFGPVATGGVDGGSPTELRDAG